MSDSELEEIRRRKLLELQRSTEEDQKQDQIQRQLELQKQAFLRKILTPTARQRLSNLKMVRKEFVEQLEVQLIQLVQQRKLPVPITDPRLKQILIQLQRHKRETTIRRM